MTRHVKKSLKELSSELAALACIGDEDSDEVRALERQLISLSAMDKDGAFTGNEEGEYALSIFSSIFDF